VTQINLISSDPTVFEEFRTKWGVNSCPSLSNPSKKGWTKIKRCTILSGVSHEEDEGDHVKTSSHISAKNFSFLYFFFFSATPSRKHRDRSSTPSRRHKSKSREGSPSRRHKSKSREGSTTREEKGGATLQPESAARRSSKASESMEVDQTGNF
jgi:hypothetical protein